MKINAVLNRKEKEYITSSCIIEKVIEISDEEFLEFRENLLSNYNFIEEHKYSMYQDVDNNYHCLLVLGENQEDGILIESEGSSYARYSSFIPNARELVSQEMKYDDVLTKFCNRMRNVAEKIINESINNNQEGMYRALISDYEEDGQLSINVPLLTEMLSVKDEIETVEDFSDEIIIQVTPQFEKEEFETITQEVADIMCAKHLLWLYDENGGKQADFTNYDLTDICLEHKNLNSAIFINAKLKNTNLENSQLCFADFSYAKIQNSQFNNCDMEESIFDDAYITDCEFENVITTNSNISQYLENQEQEQIEEFGPALSM